jgi:hypothetical protein
MDGEGVACGPDGMTNFELLRVAIGRPNLREVFLYAFDLLEFHGQDLRRESRRWRSSVPLRHFWVIFEVGYAAHRGGTAFIHRYFTRPMKPSSW